MKKIAILTNIIPPYRLPLFNGIGEKTKLDVLVCSTNEKNREWNIEKNNNFNIKKLFGIQLTLKNGLNDYRFIYLKFSILFYLLFKRPDKLIIGDASLTSYFAAFCCKLLRIKYIWWNEILPYTPISKGFVGKIRRFSIENAHHHFVSGTLAKKFISSYGISDEKITIIPDAVDNEKYFKYYEQYSPIKGEIRKKYGINDSDFVLLYVGQFIERKNIQLMLDAYKEVYNQDKSIKFIMVGGGELKDSILRFKNENNLDGLVIEDFMKEEELSKIYTISNLLILVSKSEPWGMVVNEAMCFGIPTLVSKYVGAGADLVDSYTGKIIANENNPGKLVEVIKIMKDSRWNCLKIADRVKIWSNESAVKGVLKDVS